MALFVANNGHYWDVQRDLLTIISGDLGLGDDNPGNVDAIKITYAKSALGFGPDRLNDIVNTIADTVFVVGVDSTFVVEGIPITMWVGVTGCLDAGNITCYYDVTRCGGAGYHVLDVNGKKILFPNFLILFHELCHAYHQSFGDAPLCDPQLIDEHEFQGVTDENKLRMEFGITDLRDTSNPEDPGGPCGDPPPPPATVQPEPEPEPKGDCFIATAALGAARAEDVHRLRGLRDRLLRTSAFGDQLFGHFFSEYDQFSPLIVRQMHASPQLRHLVAILTVEPLLDFFRVLELYARGGWRDQAFVIRVHGVLARCAEGFAGAGIDSEAILHTVAALRQRLSSGSGLGLRNIPHAPPGMEPEQVLDWMAACIEAWAPATRYVTWALLIPLELYWRAVASLDAAAFLAAIDNWLGEAPIPTPAGLQGEALRTDLRRLAASVLTIPGVGERLEQRLLGDDGTGNA